LQRDIWIMHREEVVMLKTSTSAYWSKEVLVASRRSLVLAHLAADDQITRTLGLWCSLCNLQYVFMEEKRDWWLSKRNSRYAVKLPCSRITWKSHQQHLWISEKQSNDTQTFKVTCKWKGKFVPVEAMKAYSGSRGTPPLILNLSASWRWVVNTTLRPLYSWEIIKESIV
jgi:hypothetical protein